MASNASTRNSLARIEANPYKPHFGPEEITDIVNETRANVERQKNEQKSVLRRQAEFVNAK